MYRDRREAAQRLIEELSDYKGQDGVVLGIPRGGVPIAFDTAQNLDFDLDIAMIKKIGHPLNKELAIGAVSLRDYIINEKPEASKTYIISETERLQQELKDNYKKFTGNEKPDYDLADKLVVITDDGVATGNTMMATINLVKKENPDQLIIAIPVAPPRIVGLLKELVEHVICPLQPRQFMAVGQFYNNFSQVSDTEVTDLIRQFERIS